MKKYAQDRDRVRAYDDTYVDGNVVRKASGAHRQLTQTERQERARNRNRAAHKNRARAQSMDLPFLIMLTIATIVALVVCYKYINVQSAISTSTKEISSREVELEKLRNDNDILQTQINTSVDLQHIYDVATGELGMVYANKDQVIEYKRTESEYVRQYENIPGAE